VFLLFSFRTFACRNNGILTIIIIIIIIIPCDPPFAASWELGMVGLSS
jgi:hypothetical protein